MEEGEEIAENILNLVLDEVEDLIIFHDSEHNIVWMNRSAQKKLDISLSNVLGLKCFKLIGKTCRCDKCCADEIIGGPCTCGCTFTHNESNITYKCTPIPYRKDGKLVMVVQNLKPCNNNY